MAYSKALNNAVKKYTKANYHTVNIRIPLNVYEQMTKCKRNDCLAAKQNTCLYF